MTTKCRQSTERTQAFEKRVRHAAGTAWPVNGSPRPIWCGRLQLQCEKSPLNNLCFNRVFRNQGNRVGNSLDHLFDFSDFWGFHFLPWPEVHTYFSQIRQDEFGKRPIERSWMKHQLETWIIAEHRVERDLLCFRQPTVSWANNETKLTVWQRHKSKWRLNLLGEAHDTNVGTPFIYFSLNALSISCARNHARRDSRSGNCFCNRSLKPRSAGPPGRMKDHRPQDTP